PPPSSSLPPLHAPLPIFALAGPAGKQRRSNRLKGNTGCRPRPLAGLLRRDDLAAAVVEGGAAQRVLGYPLGVLAHPVVVQGAPHLPVVHAERLAAVEPVRHHAVRLDPVDRDEQGGEVDDVLPDWLRLNLPPSHRLPGSGHVPTRAPWSPSAPPRRASRLPGRLRSSSGAIADRESSSPRRPPAAAPTCRDSPS